MPKNKHFITPTNEQLFEIKNAIHLICELFETNVVQPGIGMAAMLALCKKMALDYGILEDEFLAYYQAIKCEDPDEMD